MHKIEFIEAVAEKSKFSKKEVSTVLEAMLEVATDNLVAGEDVCITGFGALESRHRNARKGRNPLTGEPVQIPASRTVGFRAGKSLKTAICEYDAKKKKGKKKKA